MKKYNVIREKFDDKLKYREVQEEVDANDSNDNEGEFKCYYCNKTYSDIFEMIGDGNQGQFVLKCPHCEKKNTAKYRVAVNIEAFPVICTVCEREDTAGECVLEVGRYAQGCESNDFLCPDCAKDLKDIESGIKEMPFKWYKKKLESLKGLQSWPITQED